MKRWLLALALLVAPSLASAQNHFTLRIATPNTSNQDATHYNFFAYTGLEYNRALVPTGGCAPYTATLLTGPSGMLVREHSRRPGYNGVPGPVGVFANQAFEIYWPSPTGTSESISIRITDCDGSTATTTYTLAIGTTRFKFFNSSTGSDSNACTLAAPCQTLAAHFNTGKLGVNDIGVYRTGTYHVAGVGLPTSGSGDQVYVDWNSHDSRSTQFMAYPGETPVMDFDYLFAGVPTNHIWMQAEAFVMDGFELKNAYHQGFRINRWTGSVTARNNEAHTIGQAIEGINSAWFLWARGFTTGDVLIGNDAQDLNSGNGNILAKIYDTHAMGIVYNACAVNTNTSSDGCIAPKGGVDEFSIRANSFTGAGYAIHGDLANSDAPDFTVSSGEFAYNLFLQSDSVGCFEVGTRGAAEVVGAIYTYRNTFRCDARITNLSSDDATHVFRQNVHDNDGGTGGSCPTPYTCSGVTDYTKITVTSDYDAASSDLDADGSLTGTALTTHGPNSATPKGHMLAAAAAAAPSAPVRLRIRF